MKTAELIDYVASEAGVETSAAKKAVEAVIACIVEAAKKGEEVNLPGFGKFKVKDSPARQGRSVFGNVIFAETPMAGLGQGESRNIVFEPVRNIERSVSP